MNEKPENHQEPTASSTSQYSKPEIEVLGDLRQLTEGPDSGNSDEDQLLGSAA
jgi:hypothetical protein